MGKVTGLGDNFYIDGYDLSGDVASLDTLSSPVGVIDQTTLTYRAYARTGGKRDGQISFTTFMDINSPAVSNPSVPASGTPYVSTYLYTVYVTITGGAVTNVVINGSSVGTGPGTYALPALGSITLTYSSAPTWNWFARGTEHDALAPLPTADKISSYFQGTTVGNPCASMNAKQVNYDPTRDNNANLTIKVDATAQGYGVEWGKQLTPGIRVETGQVNSGTQIDNGASTAFGAQAYLHAFGFVGTSATVNIQDSPDNVTYTLISGMSFTVSSAPSAQRLLTANTATINRYVRVAVPFGTFTYIAFSVNFIRNLMAGVKF